MDELVFAVVVAILTFGAGLVGLRLRTRLPERHAPERAREMIVVCWSLLLFCGYGTVSPVNGTVVATLALGAIAVASAIFLILELSRPYACRRRASSRR